MTGDAPDYDPRLEAYLDGLLAPPERESFERLLESDPALRREVERQKALDTLLRRAYPVPTAEAILERLAQQTATASGGRNNGQARWERGAAAAAAPPVRSARLWKLTPLARAACIAVAALGVAAAYFVYSTRRVELAVGPAVIPAIPMHIAYQRRVEGGFEPTFPCDNEVDFAGGIWGRFGQPLLLKLPLPTGVNALGFASTNSLSPKTLMLLVRVEQTPVVVFLDRKICEQRGSAPPDTGLHLYTREIGTITAYELSPLSEPHVLDLLYVPTHLSQAELEKGARGW